MKKLILPIAFVFASLFFLSWKVDAQTNQDCRKIFNKQSYKCLTDFTACQNACQKETEKPDGSLYFNAGEIYKKCIKINDCEGKSSTCGDQALADFKICGKSGQKPTASEAKQETPSRSQKEGPSWLEFLGINPYQTWLRLQEIAEVAEFYASGDLEESLQRGFVNLFGAKTVRQKNEETVKAQEKAFESVFGKDWREQLNQPPKIDFKTEENAWKIPAPKEESVTDIPGTIDSKRYSWEADSGAIIKSNDWEKIEFKEPTVEDDVITRTVKFKDGEMEVKVKNDKPTVNRFAVDANGFFDLVVIQTHFLVSYNPDARQGAVIVYEGEVEVKNKDGKVIKVKPDGNKPGVVVVTQKLSVVKLAGLGMVLVVAISGVAFILRKRLSSKSFKKKK